MSPCSCFLHLFFVYRFLLVIILDVSPVESSHFRGGIITWRPVTQPVDGSLPMIEFSWRVSWRRDSSNNFCSVPGTSLRGEGSLSCNCLGLSLPLRYVCTDFSAIENWTTGTNSGLYQPTSTTFDVWFSGNCWLPLINGGGSWFLGSSVEISVRTDTGSINTSPTTATPPIVRLKSGCTNTLIIPTLDADQDDTRCFWATSCGGICGPVPGFNLDESCTIVSDTTSLTTGLYGMALQIRDFATEESSTPLSEIPLQFLIQIYTTVDDCSDVPIVISPTRTCGTCVIIPPGEAYTDQVVARAATAKSITRFETVSPPGSIISSVTPYSEGTANDYVIDIFWDPGASTREEFFCFAPVDTSGNSGQLCCISLVPSETPLQIVSSSVSGLLFVMPIDLNVEFTFNKLIARPENSRFISLFDERDNMLFQVDASDDSEVDFNGEVISFVIPAQTFGKSKEYYITLDESVARTTVGCLEESAAVTDKSTWTFTQLQEWDFQCIVTPPVLALRSLKPINLLALAGGGPDQFSMTFRGRDNPGYYSDGMFVEFSEVKGTFTGDASLLRRHGATLRQPSTEYNKADRFGVHYSLIPKDSIRMVIVSVGETLTLCVKPNLPRRWKGPIVWTTNGLRESSWLRRWTGSTCIHVKHVQTCQAGVYEAYRRICGRREKQHAFFDVRVRACPNGFHTPPSCTSTCSASCVLGYCGDDGSCVCRNGMTGDDCDTATAGHLGLKSGDVPCASVGLDPECKGSLVCTQRAGCSCFPGWKGINCDEECGQLKWGPDCVFSCTGGIPCDRFTGST